MQKDDKAEERIVAVRAIAIRVTRNNKVNVAENPLLFQKHANDDAVQCIGDNSAIITVLENGESYLHRDPNRRLHVDKGSYDAARFSSSRICMVYDIVLLDASVVTKPPSTRKIKITDTQTDDARDKPKKVAAIKKPKHALASSYYLPTSELGNFRELDPNDKRVCRTSQVRVPNGVVVNPNETREPLQLMYISLHKPVLVYQQENGQWVKNMKCPLPQELQGVLGDPEKGIDDVTNDVEKLADWGDKASKAILEVDLCNLEHCGHDALYLYDLSLAPQNAHRVKDCPQEQIRINIDWIRRCMKWFMGNGKQPKWRVELYNWKRNRVISGKAAPPWNVVLNSYVSSWDPDTMEPTVTPWCR